MTATALAHPLIFGLLTSAVWVVPLAVATWAIARWMRRPAIAHALWVLILLKLLVPPLYTPSLMIDSERWPVLAAILPKVNTPSQGKDSTSADSQKSGGIKSFGSSDAGFQSGEQPASQAVLKSSELDSAVQNALWANNAYASFVQWLSSPIMVLLTLWALGAVIFVWTFAYRTCRIVAIVKQFGRPCSRSTKRGQTLLGKSLRSSPQVLVVDAILPPTLVGIGPWTRILLPKNLWQKLPDEQKDSLLVHEIEHFRRGDHWVRALEALATGIFWWHPFVWWIRRQIHIAEESCCDAAAVGGSGEKSRIYAEALLATLDFISESACRPRVALSTGIGSVPEIELRLREIMSRSVRGKLCLTSRATVLCLTLILLPIQPWLVQRNPLFASSKLPISSIPEAAQLARDDLTNGPLLDSILNDGVHVVANKLPEPPIGWWNQGLPDRWAKVQSRTSNSGQLLISAGRKIQLVNARGTKPIDLSNHQLTAAAFWQSGSRLITGDEKGQVRLWDVRSGEPVSLLGCHASAVTSVAINEEGLLVTGGRDGAVMAWDIQSGTVKAVWTADETPIQSVRISPDGSQVFVVADDWRAHTGPARIICLDSNTLGVRYQFNGPPSVAAIQITQSDMIIADWSGSLYCIDSFGLFEMVGSVSKEAVSAAAFSQDVPLLDQRPNGSALRT